MEGNEIWREKVVFPRQQAALVKKDKLIDKTAHSLDITSFRD